MANRVGEIQSMTNPEQWRHVPTKQNPADLLTRGLRVTELNKEVKWWNGPPFLRQDQREWPETKIEAKQKPDIEIRKQCCAQGQAEEQTFVTSTSEDRLDPTRYSSWTRLTRVSVRVNSFLDNCRLPPNLRRKGAIKPEEITTAGMRFITLSTRGIQRGGPHCEGGVGTARWIKVVAFETDKR